MRLNRVIELTRTTANIETRTAAVELFHAVVVFTIGRCNELGGKVSFASVFERLFPEMLRLASDIQQVPRSIFEPLCHQTVRWLATTTNQESPEVAVLLDALLGGAADKSNATLREHCAVCIAEYFDWHVRHISEDKLKDNPHTVKSLMRKIQSFAIHPDSFKQLAALICFDKLLVFLQKEQNLADLYLMGIAITCLSALKRADKSLCATSAKHLSSSLTKALKHYKIVLMRENEKRAGVKTVRMFSEMVFEKTCASAELCRTAAQQLWVAVADPDPREWLRLYANRMTQVSTQTQFTLIEHVQYNKEQIGVYMKAERISAEKFDAQVQCVKWLIKNKFVDWKNVERVLGIREFANFGVNVANFFKMINEGTNIQARELRNNIIRLNLVAFTNLMELFQLLMEESLLLDYLKELNISNDCVVDTLLIAATDPQGLDLELGAPDKALMQRYNEQVQETLKQFTRIANQKALLSLRINRLHRENKMTHFFIGQGLLKIPTNRLIQICLGHLELYRTIYGETVNYIVIPESASELFAEQKKILISCIEAAISEASPQGVQKVRVVLKYLLHLGIPYSKLEQWLIDNCALYQHCSATLIDYIIGSWEANDLPKCLIRSCRERKEMLAVILPVLRRLIFTNRVSYIRVFYDAIPDSWNDIVADINPIINELKIYQIIVGVSRTRLLNSLCTASGKVFLQHCLNRAKEFLKESYSVMVKKEALLLVAEGWELGVGERTFGEQLSADLKEVQKQYFPIKTTDLEKLSKGAVNFEIMLDSFINIFAVNLDYRSLSWLFLVLRESTSPYLVKLKPSLSSYIQKIIGATQKVFKEEVESIFKLFVDPEVICTPTE